MRRLLGIAAIFGTIIVAATLAMIFSPVSLDSFRCWSSEYGPAYYLQSCVNPGFVAFDYQAGALYYGIEPGVHANIRRAQVIFLGSSKMQAAFSTDATLNYFAGQNVRFYLLGLGGPNLGGATLPIWKRVRPHPRLVVINADPFFAVPIPEHTRDLYSGGIETYWMLAWVAGMQRVQRLVCPTFPSVCSPTYRTVYRSARNGRWYWRNSYMPEQSIPQNDLLHRDVPDDRLAAAADAGERFLREIGLPRDCIVFTGIPNNHYDAPAIARRLADRLGTAFILPEVDGIMMLDDAHMNFSSAEHWSAAFLERLTPVLQRCAAADGMRSGQP